MKASSLAKKILKTFPEDVQEYFFKIDEKLKKRGVTLFFGSGKSLYKGGKCSGYFCPTSKTLAVAIGRGLEDFLSDFFHEYSHYLQYANKNSIWHNYRIYNGHSRFFGYLDGKKIYKPQKAALAAIRLEADCERRAIKLAKKWQKYINLEAYQAKANAYILSYHHMLKTGKWLKKSPYDRKIIAHSPTKLMRDYRKVPWRLEAAFDRWL